MAVVKNGFTLIELIVAFSVISILATVGVASFVSYSRLQTLQTATYELSTTLGLARSRAYSQVKPSECTGQTSLDGYRVTLSVSDNSYVLDAICSGSSHTELAKTLPKDITFDRLQSTSTSFLFPVIAGGVVGAGKIVVSGYGQTKTITVNSAGDIR